MPGCNALRDGHDDRCVLKELHSSSRFGIKIARISSIHNSERRTPRHEYVAYPDAEDELKAGVLVAMKITSLCTSHIMGICRGSVMFQPLHS